MLKFYLFFTGLTFFHCGTGLAGELKSKLEDKKQVVAKAAKTEAGKGNLKIEIEKDKKRRKTTPPSPSSSEYFNYLDRVIKNKGLPYVLNNHSKLYAEFAKKNSYI